MAQWVSANLSKLLPGAVDTIFTAIKALTTTVSVPLKAVQSALNVASAFLTSLDPLDFLTTVRSLINSFKNNLIGSGYYLLDMWDYPIKQLQPSTFGPENTVDALRLTGDSFQSSFQQDLLDSFDDADDTNRPQFTGSVVIMILVSAKGTLDDLGIIPEEDHLGFAWKGLDAPINQAGQAVQELRWRASFSRMRAAAEVQSVNKVATRVERVQRVSHLFSFMSREEIDLLPVPMDPETGESFFEDLEASDLDWEEDVVPILETVEAHFESHEYPDWERATLYEVYPDLQVIVDTVFDAVLDLLETGGTILQAIKDLVNAIKAKLDELDRLIALIDELEEQLEALLNATGLHVLFVTSENGVTDLKTKIQSATNIPFTGNGFYAGMAVLVGGPQASLFNTLFGPIAT
jgi:hypothetical protein